MSNYPTGSNIGIDNDNDLENEFMTINTDQTITGKKIFDEIEVENEIIHNYNTFTVKDAIVEFNKDNTSADTTDSGFYSVYNAGSGIRYRGIINKGGTDQYYVFNAQSDKPTTTLNTSNQLLASMLVRQPTENNEVANKAYVDSHASGNYLPLDGSSPMTGNINMGNNEIDNIKRITFNDQQSSTAIVFQDNQFFDIMVDNGTADNIYIRFNSNFNLLEFQRPINNHGNITMLSNSKITGLPDTGSGTDAVNYNQLTNNYLPLSGGTMSGNINMKSNQISSVSKMNIRNPDNNQTSPLNILTLQNGLTRSQILSSNNVHQSQISFGYKNTTDYKHFICTRHSGNIVDGAANAFDFYTNKGDMPPDNNISDTQHSLTIDRGKLGVGEGNYYPKETLDVMGNSIFRGNITIGSDKINFSDNTKKNQILFNTNDNSRIQCDPSDNIAMYFGTNFWALDANRTYTNVDMVMNGKKITGLPDPTSGSTGSQAATKNYVDNAVNGTTTGGTYLSTTGGIMSGDIEMGGNDISTIGSNLTFDVGQANNINYQSNLSFIDINATACMTMDTFEARMWKDFNMNGNTLKELKYPPIATTEATSKKYVDEVAIPYYQLLDLTGMRPYTNHASVNSQTFNSGRTTSGNEELYYFPINLDTITGSSLSDLKISIDVQAENDNNIIDMKRQRDFSVKCSLSQTPYRSGEFYYFDETPFSFFHVPASASNGGVIYKRYHAHMEGVSSVPLDSSNLYVGFSLLYNLYSTSSGGSVVNRNNNIPEMNKERLNFEPYGLKFRVKVEKIQYTEL